MSKVAALFVALASVVGHTSPGASVNCRTLPVMTRVPAGGRRLMTDRRSARVVWLTPAKDGSQQQVDDETAG